MSTYQSVTGSGLKGINQLEGEREGREVKKAYAHQIDRNCLPHCDSFTDNGYTKEEMKLVNETCKILGDDTIKVTATAVRVPVMGGHSESVNIEFKQDYDLNELRELLAHSEGIVVQDDPARNLYPMAITANEKDEVFVGRIRRDFSQPNKCRTNCGIFIQTSIIITRKQNIPLWYFILKRNSPKIYPLWRISLLKKYSFISVTLEHFLGLVY